VRKVKGFFKGSGEVLCQGNVTTEAWKYYIKNHKSPKPADEITVA
jgi:hypothetical protein